MDDKLNVESLRALDEAATAGPWKTQKPSLYPEDSGLCIIGLRLHENGEPMETPTNGLVAVATQTPVEADEGDFERAEANAALLTYLRNAVPAILAMAEENARSEKHRNDLYDKVMAQVTEIGALKAQNARLREALEAEDAYWTASRALAATLPRLRGPAQDAFEAATRRRDAARLALKETPNADR